MTDERSPLRDSLVPGTIENARKIPFYQRLYAGIDLSAVLVTSDLERLPVIDKALFRAKCENEMRPDAPPPWITHTMGTTGSMTFRYRVRRSWTSSVTSRSGSWNVPGILPRLRRLSCG